MGNRALAKKLKGPTQSTPDQIVIVGAVVGVLGVLLLAALAQKVDR
jgi:hypothetical protein